MPAQKPAISLLGLTRVIHACIHTSMHPIRHPPIHHPHYVSTAPNSRAALRPTLPRNVPPQVLSLDETRLMAPTQCACVGPLSSGACHQRQPPQRELEPLVSERCNSRSGRLTTSRPVLAIRWLASNRTADDRHGGGIIHLHHTRIPGHDSFRSLPSREQGGGGKQPEPGGRRAGWSPMTLDIGPRHPQSQPTVPRPSFSGRNLTPPPMHWLSKDCRRPGLSRHAPNVAPPPTPGTHAREKRHRLMHKSISDPFLFGADQRVWCASAFPASWEHPTHAAHCPH